MVGWSHHSGRIAGANNERGINVTMTDDAVRTYAVGESMTEDDYRTRSEACWTQDGGYGCNLPPGHKGPQHVAAVRYPDRDVVHVWDRDTADDDVEPTPEPIVEQPTPEVVAERLATVQRELGEAQDQLHIATTASRDARAEIERLQTEHDEFRQRVVDTAMELARRHDWCTVVQAGLTDMGLGDLLTKNYRVTVTLRAERTVTVQVAAASGEEAWQMVDRMGESDLSDAYEEENGNSLNYDVLGDEWSLTGQDANTRPEQIDD